MLSTIPCKLNHMGGTEPLGCFKILRLGATEIPLDTMNFNSMQILFLIKGVGTANLDSRVQILRTIKLMVISAYI